MLFALEEGGFGGFGGFVRLGFRVEVADVVGERCEDGFLCVVSIVVVLVVVLVVVVVVRLSDASESNDAAAAPFFRPDLNENLERGDSRSLASFTRSCKPLIA